VSNQGFRYYKGLAWYRQVVDVRPSFKGSVCSCGAAGWTRRRRSGLTAKPVGISPGAAFYPFEMDATEAVRAGENESHYVLCGQRGGQRVGTGGIVAPVFLYAPAAGKDAKLENLKPLGETFP